MSSVGRKRGRGSRAPPSLRHGQDFHGLSSRRLHGVHSRRLRRDLVDPRAWSIRHCISVIVVMLCFSMGRAPPWPRGRAPPCPAPRRVPYSMGEETVGGTARWGSPQPPPRFPPPCWQDERRPTPGSDCGWRKNRAGRSVSLAPPSRAVVHGNWRPTFLRLDELLFRRDPCYTRCRCGPAPHRRGPCPCSCRLTQ
jgi:hypothetical protein